MNNRAKLVDIFNLSKDKDWRDGKLLQSFKIVSLWTMLEFHARNFLEVSVYLAKLDSMIDMINAAELRGDLKLDNEIDEILAGFNRLKDHIQRLHKSLMAMELPVSAEATSMLLMSRVNQNRRVALNALKFQATHVVFAIRAELADRYAMMIPTDRVDFYRKEETFLGKEVAAKFSRLPGFQEDATEAGNCFALGRYTACVFHLMRLMENIVQRFGRKVKIPIDIKNAYWDTILRQVKKLTEIKETDDIKVKKKKRRYQSFYDRFDAVRVAWRNPTMHPKTTYTEDEAKEVMDAVRLFVTDFSKLR